MNKHQFLEELRRSISVLEDSEQADIINEYSQHIDMKVEGGMSEAEAIEDFGSLDQLVEDVLAAYHVKAPEKKTPSDTQALVEGSKQVIGAAVGSTKRGVSKIKSATASALSSAKAKASKAQAAANPECEPGVNANAKTSPMDPITCKTKPPSGVHKMISRTASGITRGTRSLWEAAVTIAKALLRWCWNALVACIALCAFIGAICAVFAFGFCIVLMVQGYPLFGVSIASLGLIVSLTCAGLLLLRFVLLKKPEGETQPKSPAVPFSQHSNPTFASEVI